MVEGTLEESIQIQAGADISGRGNANFLVGTTEGGIQLNQLILYLIKLKEGFLRDPRHLSPPTTFCLPKPTSRYAHLPFQL